MKRNIIIACMGFLSLTALTYALGTWDTGFRANDGVDTTVDINALDLFDNLIVENSHGEDLFVPTKTNAEILSMWDNTPTNTCIYTEGEWIGGTTIDASVETYSSHSETDCDTPDGDYGSGFPFVTSSRFHVLKIEAPFEIEGYLNMRFRFSTGDTEENLRLFIQKEGEAVVPESYFLTLYSDGAATGLNGPDLDYDNDGNDDLYIISIDDPWDGATTDITLSTPTKIQLSSGTNYIRFEGYDAAGLFSCESGNYTGPESIDFSGVSSGRNVWFSSGLCPGIM